MLFFLRQLFALNAFLTAVLIRSLDRIDRPLRDAVLSFAHDRDTRFANWLMCRRVQNAADVLYLLGAVPVYAAGTIAGVVSGHLLACYAAVSVADAVWAFKIYRAVPQLIADREAAIMMRVSL